jgi:hypothetical protein
MAHNAGCTAAPGWSKSSSAACCCGTAIDQGTSCRGTMLHACCTMPKNHKPHKKDLTPSSQSKAFHQSSFSPSGKVLDLADRSMEGSMGSMANAIAHKLFQPKANSHYPRRHIFSIDGQWQKSLTPQKNLIPTNSSSTRVSTDPSLIFSYGVISSEFVQPTLCIVMTIPAKSMLKPCSKKQ